MEYAGYANYNHQNINALNNELMGISSHHCGITKAIKESMKYVNVILYAVCALLLLIALAPVIV